MIGLVAAAAAAVSTITLLLAQMGANRQREREHTRTHGREREHTRTHGREREHTRTHGRARSAPPPSFDVPVAEYPVEVITDPPSPTPSPSPAVGPKAAAQSLYEYVVAAIRAGHGEQLGSRGRPNATVRARQSQMGRILADGIYGPATRSRGKELLGREFPSRADHARTPARARSPLAAVLPAPLPMRAFVAPTSTQAPTAVPRQPEEGPTISKIITSARAPQVAARDLLAYARERIAAKRGSDLGTKVHPSIVVRAAQADMGELIADGIYGPATRSRGKSLLGQSFPVRV